MDDPGPRDLLAKAIQRLDPDEQRQVTSWLVGRVFEDVRGTQAVGVGSALIRETRNQMLASLGAGAAGGRRGDYQVVPIRLPADQHAALRDWCADRGFTMATVVRGLVERFLEEQGRGPGQAA
jgi:hypothetical protein